jgi:hypothetical protein
MEPEDLVHCWQESATGPYPEVHESGPHPPNMFLKIHSYTVLPSVTRSSEWSLPFMFWDQLFLYISYSSHTCYMTHSSWFDQPNNIWLSVQVTTLLTVLLQPPTISSSLGPYILCSIPFSNTLCSSLSVRDQVSCLYKTTGKIILIFKFLERSCEDRFYLFLIFLECSFDLLLLFPHTWSLPHFWKIY